MKKRLRYHFNSEFNYIFYVMSIVWIKGVERSYNSNIVLINPFLPNIYIFNDLKS